MDKVKEKERKNVSYKKKRTSNFESRRIKKMQAISDEVQIITCKTTSLS